MTCHGRGVDIGFLSATRSIGMLRPTALHIALIQRTKYIYGDIRSESMLAWSTVAV
jgi:hypothetical protein